MKSVVIGGAGAFGRALVRDLKAHGFSPVSVDFAKCEDAVENILLDSKKSLRDQVKFVSSSVAEHINGDRGLNSVFSTAGGWAGGSAGDENFLEIVHQMHTMNLESAALAAHLAVNHLDKNGLLLLTGAEAARNSTPSMLGYGLSKAATHYLVRSVAEDPAFVEKNASALALLPVTIDTPMNRKFMPDADHSSWTKPEVMARLCVDKAKNISRRPQSGSLMTVMTVNGDNSLCVYQPSHPVVVTTCPNV